MAIPVLLFVSIDFAVVGNAGQLTCAGSSGYTLAISSTCCALIPVMYWIYSLNWSFVLPRVFINTGKHITYTRGEKLRVRDIQRAEGKHPT